MVPPLNVIEARGSSIAFPVVGRAEEVPLALGGAGGWGERYTAETSPKKGPGRRNRARALGRSSYLLMGTSFEIQMTRVRGGVRWRQKTVVSNM